MPRFKKNWLRWTLFAVEQSSWMVKCHAMPRQVLSHPQPGDNLPSYLNITGLSVMLKRSLCTNCPPVFCLYMPEIHASDKLQRQVGKWTHSLLDIYHLLTLKDWKT